VSPPERIQALPKEGRGYPVPFFAAVIKGKPDFRVLDEDKWLKAVQGRLCSVCGAGLGKQVAFVGGPRSMASGFFTDAGMHPECAEYALQVCPYLAAPKFGHIETHPSVEAGEARIIAAMHAARPERFGLGITHDYTLARLMPANEIVIKAESFTSITWWVNGIKVEATEI
tara:strand:- start:508 stop:1020 length:513 start_codon:yes stop_codon:yes gene_type:complete